MSPSVEALRISVAVYWSLQRHPPSHWAFPLEQVLPVLHKSLRQEPRQSSRVSLCVGLHAWRQCLQKPQEGVRSPRARVTQLWVAGGRRCWSPLQPLGTSCCYTAACLQTSRVTDVKSGMLRSARASGRLKEFLPAWHAPRMLMALRSA